MTALRNIGAIFQKEWRHYFGSPIAYVALVVWLGLFGLFFSIALGFFLQASASPNPGGGQLNINDWVIGSTLQSMAVVTLFIMPMLTMRLFAEEKRQGTIELLATAPLTNLQIILGKFFGALGFYALMLLVALLNIAPLWFVGTPPEWQLIATNVLALLLLGGALIAIGQFLSSLTTNQIVAGALAFGVALGFWILSWLDDPTADATRKVLAYLGLLGHTEDLMKGVIDLKHVVYYLTFTVFGLFLTHQSLEAQRWRA